MCMKCWSLSRKGRSSYFHSGFEPKGWDLLCCFLVFRVALEKRHGKRGVHTYIYTYIHTYRLYWLRMYDTYISNQKFHSIRIWLLHDITKIWNFFLHLFCIIIMPKSYWIIGKKNCSTNNQVTYNFFISNKFFWSFRIHMNFLKKIEAITMQLLIQSPRKFFCVM